MIWILADGKFGKLLKQVCGEIWEIIGSIVALIINFSLIHHLYDQVRGHGKISTKVYRNGNITLGFFLFLSISEGKFQVLVSPNF